MSDIETVLAEVVKLLQSLDKKDRKRVLAATKAFYEDEIADDEYVRVPVLSMEHLAEMAKQKKTENPK